MEKSKRKNGELHLRRYWLFFVPLMLILALMIPHPLRFGIGELSDDGLLYGVVALLCLIAAIRVFRRAGRRGISLVAIILTCALLAAWQPFDIFVLRTGTRSPAAGHDYNGNEPDTNHWFAWYIPRFRNDDIQCHSYMEYYFGTRDIAITLEILRDATWFACGDDSNGKNQTEKRRASSAAILVVLRAPDAYSGADGEIPGADVFCSLMLRCHLLRGHFITLRKESLSDVSTFQ